MNLLSPAQNTGLGMVCGVEVRVTPPASNHRPWPAPSPHTRRPHLQVLVVVQPMIFFKVRVQQGLPLLLDPRQVYRGLPVSASSQAAITGVQFFSTGYIKRIFTGT